jgi:hypothetical protein
MMGQSRSGRRSVAGNCSPSKATAARLRRPFSQDGRRLVTGSGDGRPRSGPDTARSFTQRTRLRQVLDSRAANERHRSYDNTVKIWEATSINELPALRGHKETAAGVAFFRLPATRHCSEDRRPRSGRSAAAELLRLRAPRRFFPRLRPDGRRIATPAWISLARSGMRQRCGDTTSRHRRSMV